MSHTTASLKNASGSTINAAVNQLSGDSSLSNEVTLIKPDGTQINPATSDAQTTTNTGIGAPSDSAVTNPASSASIIAALKGLLTTLQAAIPAGSATIGNVGLIAGSNLVGAAIAPHQTGVVYSGTTALTPKFASITASSSGATTVVAAVTSKKIRVLKVTLIANAAVNVKFQSHVTPTDLTGLFYCGANGGVGMTYCPLGHFETVAGEALDINLSSAVAVGGVLTYVEV